MKSFAEIKNTLAKYKEDLKQKYKVKKIGIFGSHVRNEQKKRSDIDVLVEFKEIPGLFKFIELEGYLGKILGAKVDLVMKDALKPYIGKHILREVIYL